MGEHNAPDSGVTAKAMDVARWVWRNRRKVAAVALVAVPVVARCLPGFPAEEAVSVLRAFLGA
ncbi:hypothetical protein OHB41_03670 [Streptomyces sp. NBC_01571]|uniref:hypothetical protein n=1 Tax=Streptomyces sp. NBC_01571 TaxID=2975883 RepID=UPI00224D07CC|nr:hypothetical protein [Streptomyces sp. NBC_01571]MCX4572297.1 hypothetical protein [Streptomyces sp. NBC_01571]